MRNKLAVWGIVIAVVGFFFGYIAGQGNVAKAPAGSGEITRADTASLMVDYGNGMVRTYGDLPVRREGLVGNATVLDITKALAEKEKLEFKTKDYGEIGLLLEQFGDKTSGDDGKYWQYWVNNVSSQIAASILEVQPGDVIEWKFLNYR